MYLNGPGISGTAQFLPLWVLLYTVAYMGLNSANNSLSSLFPKYSQPSRASRTLYSSVAAYPPEESDTEREKERLPLSFSPPRTPNLVSLPKERDGTVIAFLLLILISFFFQSERQREGDQYQMSS